MKKNGILTYHIQGIHFVDDFRAFLTTQADKTKKSTKKSLYSGVLQETLQLDEGRLYFETVAVHSPKNEKLNQDSIIIRKEMATCADLIPTQYIGFTKEADLTEWIEEQYAKHEVEQLTPNGYVLGWTNERGYTFTFCRVSK